MLNWGRIQRVTLRHWRRYWRKRRLRRRTMSDVIFLYAVLVTFMYFFV